MIYVYTYTLSLTFMLAIHLQQILYIDIAIIHANYSKTILTLTQ